MNQLPEFSSTLIDRGEQHPDRDRMLFNAKEDSGHSCRVSHTAPEPRCFESLKTSKINIKIHPRSRPLPINKRTENCFMQPEKIILLPSTHESLPSFHVQRELLRPFLHHLAISGIKVAEPPESLGDLEPGATSLVAVEVQEGISLKQLQEALDEFLRSLSKSSPKQSSE